MFGKDPRNTDYRLTESSGKVRFKDIINKVTVHEEVDEITGMSRLIIVDSPDEKKQPAVEIVAAGAGDTGAHAKVLNRYHMPSNAHLMVGNNDMVMPGDVIASLGLGLKAECESVVWNR